jgi:hypothetical protein
VIGEAKRVERLLDGDRDAIFSTIALSSWLIPETFVVGAILGCTPLFPLSDQGELVGAVAVSVLLSLEKIGSTTIRERVQAVDIWAAESPSHSTT